MNDNHKDDIHFQEKPEDTNKQRSFEVGYIFPFRSSKPRNNYSLDV
jgi:hypothetical protein